VICIAAVVDECRGVVEQDVVGVHVGDGEIVDGGVAAGLLDGCADGVCGPGVSGEPVSNGGVAGVLPAVAAVEGVVGPTA